MKRIFTLVFILSTFLSLNAADWVDLHNGGQISKNFNIISSSANASTIHFALDGFWKNDVETSKGIAWSVTAKNSGLSLIAGYPELPVFATSVIIPNQAKMQVKIVDSQYQEFTDVLIAPSKGNLLRTINPANVPYVFGKQYNVNSFYPTDISSLRTPYIIRDYRAQTIVIQPIVYNPITKVLRVYTNITIELTENGVSQINIISGNKPVTTVDESFNKIYAHQFLNYNDFTLRYTPVEEMGNMLIISYGDFMDEMQPFIDWKIKSGTPVEIIDVATIGGASDIKQYIANYYNNNGLTFVMLVGDAAQVPSSLIGGNDSDVDYSYVVGSDHYPDLFVGRFSAETAEQVVTQVTRVLDYEQTPIADTTWYSQIIGIASDQGPGDDNEYDYEHNRNINTDLLSFTYVYANELYDGSQGGNDAPGNPTPSMVTDVVNSGATIINYTGHGSNTSWGTSGFSNSNVNNLTNNGKLPFIFSVACVNGNFVNTTCFAEAWLRAENNGEPAGAMATFMSTINQSWNPPMRGQDEMNDILSEVYSDNIKRTFGGIALNGCMNMNDIYGSAGDEMTDTWTVFGDPSLEIRTATPQNMAVTVPSSLPLGSTSMNITCNAEGALATLSMNGEILGTAIVESGMATISFNALNTIGTADFVITAFNYIPYISTIDVVVDAGAFVTYASNIINDSAGNNNQLMDYTENILLTVGLMNSGVDDATGVTAILSTNSEYIQIVNNQAYYGNIAANDTVDVTDGFQFIVTDSIPNEEVVTFEITAQDDTGETWESSFTITGHSPELNFNSFDVDDSNGNNNGKIEPGETVNLIVYIENNGSSQAYNTIADLQTLSQYVTINSGTQTIGNMPEDIIDTISFNITAHGDTPEGTFANFNVNILADYNITGNGSFGTVIGQKPILIVDLAHSSSTDSILGCLSELQVGNDVVAELSSGINSYQAVFVLLGIYPNNYALNASDGGILASYIENGGRAYMEGGDAWAFDTQTPAHELFNINGTEDGMGDLSTIVGEDAGIMAGYSLEYAGNNSYIDHIAPKNGSTLIFSNDNPNYGTGVSFENETYKTIGTSFEFAGLVDQAGGSTKDGVMAEILYFFGINYTWTGIDDYIFNALDINAYPNPATDNIAIQFALNKSSETSLYIYDLTGRKVITLLSTERQSAGKHVFKWDITNVKAGIYFYRLTIGNKSVTKKIIVSR